MQFKFEDSGPLPVNRGREGLFILIKLLGAGHYLKRMAGCIQIKQGMS